MVVPTEGREAKVRTTTETRNLPVKLTEDELAGKAQELAESVAAEEKLREEFAAWEDTMKQAKKAKQGRIAIAHDDTVNLGQIVETGIEDRDVACTWLYTKEAAYLRRDDTGELVQVRDLRADEKQAVIGEEAVVQEPTFEDFRLWGGAYESTVAGRDTIEFPNGVSVDLDDREAAMRELEKVVRESMR